MTRLEYFKSLFPNVRGCDSDIVIRYCPYKLGIINDKCNYAIKCKDCWNKPMNETLPKYFTQHLLDKFTKLW